MPLKFELSDTSKQVIRTPEFSTYLSNLYELHSNQLKHLKEINQIADFNRRLEVANEKYPALYKILKKYHDTVIAHMRSMNVGSANVFYGKYIEKLGSSIKWEDGKSDYVGFLKYAIGEWDNVDVKGQRAFANQFPGIVKILKDKDIRRAVMGKDYKSNEPSKQEQFWENFKENPKDAIKNLVPEMKRHRF